MMRYVLDLVYLTLLAILSPLLLFAALRHGKYRDGWSEKVQGFLPRLPAATNRRIWFHAVSVGEVNLLVPILKELLASAPHTDIVITTTTKTGHGLALQRFPEHTVAYCPLDFSWAVHNAFQRLQPDALVLVELELWPNLLLEARRCRIPVAIVNGRLSDRSTKGYLRIRNYLPGPTQRVLSCISVVGAQSKACAERFQRIGIPADRVQMTGSIKFDGAATDRRNPLSRQLRALSNFPPNAITFVAGSTQAPEELYAIELFQQLQVQHPNLRLVLVPRHPERGDEVASLLDASQIRWRRRTEIGDTQLIDDEQAILVDTVGELNGWWGLADIGFVGGSMGKRGGQNMLEPSGYAVATCFGPNTRNFRDVVEQLLNANAAEVVQDADEMRTFVRRCLEDEAFAMELGKRAQQVVVSQRGAARKTVQMLSRLGTTTKSSFRTQLSPLTLPTDVLRKSA